jgi:YidC/Oxa1 family membrane protein insertase
MDGNTVLRWSVIALLMLGVYWLLNGRKSGDDVQGVPQERYVDAPGFAPDVFLAPPGQPQPPPPPEGALCTIHGNRFEADLASRGAGVTHLRLTDKRYTLRDEPNLLDRIRVAFGAEPAPVPDPERAVLTTPDHERWRNLRTLFRTAGSAPSPDDQVKYDRFDWTLDKHDGKTCAFSYQDDRVRIEKTIAAGERPFELNVDTKLTNLSDAPKTHSTSIELFAWRTNAEVKGKLGRVSPFQTGVECARGGEVERKSKGDKAFKSPPFWLDEPLVDRYAAVANYYFAQALVPLDVAPGESGADNKPACGVLIEQWFGEGQPPDSDEAGDIYHARLEYPKRTLQPKESTTYRQVAFFGPKERNVLADAAGGKARLQDLINLGTFSIIAKYLVMLISWIHAHLTGGNWGLAIIVLTVGLKIALFPLTWKQIQSTVEMRRLKPEMDALNAKFKDDAQAKQVATMELYRKHKVNPLGGCLPALVQMPIWFALYATLQTAVEFYHTSFLWFTDLSAPDKFFVLPLVLGLTMIAQQRIVPQQGMDPVQAKVMAFLMPGVFTVMMLFLPAALGVYMLTNSALGITQQLVVEKLFPRTGKPAVATSSAG